LAREKADGTADENHDKGKQDVTAAGTAWIVIRSKLYSKQNSLPRRRFSMTDYSHILLAIDFSPATDSVTQQAMKLSRAFKTRLSLVHVVEFMSMNLSNDMALPQEVEFEQELVEQTRQRLQQLGEKLGIDQSDCFVPQGSTRQVILQLAKEQNVDLIVIGSHGRQGIQRLLGSTANAVLHGAPCDVLAVRVKD
jgi:universal stress protein A